MRRKIIKSIFIVSVVTLAAIILYTLIHTLSVMNSESDSGVGIIGGADSPTFLFLFFSYFKLNSLLGVLGRLALLGSFSGILLLFHKK